MNSCNLAALSLLEMLFSHGLRRHGRRATQASASYQHEKFKSRITGGRSHSNQFVSYLEKPSRLDKVQGGTHVESMQRMQVYSLSDQGGCLRASRL